MMPAHAATQKIRREATSRSYSGLAARRCRITKAAAPARAIAASPNAAAPALGTAAKLIASTSAEIITTDRSPPRLSTGSVDSFTCAGTILTASTSATAASGKVIRNTEPHQ